MSDPVQAHDHQPQSLGRAFAIGIVLNSSFIIIEVIFGLLSNSLALLSDAGHNLADVMGLLVAWGAIYLSEWQPTHKHTYGLRKSSVLATLINALFLLVSIGAISWEAVKRLQAPSRVQVNTVIWVAAGGIIVNAATALLFASRRKADINIRGAFLHMLADAGISAGVVLVGLLMSLTGLMIIDPIVSIAISISIFIGTWNLFRESMNMALDAVPEKIDADAIKNYLAELPTVKDVHHVHIWSLSTTEAAMTAHVVLLHPELDNALLSSIRQELHERYGIEHATIQFEACENDICLTRQCSLHYSRGQRE